MSNWDKAAVTVESYRTRTAKLAGAAAALKRQSGAAAPFSLAFMTDAARAPRPELVARALPGGAAIILRDYDLPGRRAIARRIVSIARPRGVLVLIGNDAALARDIGADGVHLPSWAGYSDARGDGLISCACHDEAGLQNAARLGADVAFLSPAFATQSHPDAPALGAQRFKTMAATAALPVLALGGVDERNAGALAGPKVAGIAAIGAFSPR